MPQRDDFDVDGLRVLITGSSRGLGEGVAEYLAACGAAVAVHGRDAERVEAVRARLDDRGAKVIAVTGDTRDADAVRAFVAEAAAGLRGLDGVVNNAGGTFGAAADAISANGFNAILQVNLTGPFLVAQAALPYLEETKGSIVNVSSASGTRATPNFAHYGAAKAGLNNLTKTLAAEWGARGVRVNAVVPGLMLTDAAVDSLFGDDDDALRASESRTALGRLGTPKDLAHVCRFLLSSASSFITGETIALDGGPPNVPGY